LASVPGMAHTRDDVIAAAGRLFAERGFHGTSMRELGNELGLLGSSLYSHVSGKSELLVEVIARGAGFFSESADVALADGGTAPDRLRRLVRGHVEVLVDHAAEARTFLDEARYLPPADRRRAVAMRDEYESRWRQVMVDGIDEGSLPADLDPRLGSILTFSTLNALIRWYDPTGPLGPDEIAGVLADHTLAALGAGTATAHLAGAETSQKT